MTVRVNVRVTLRMNCARGCAQDEGVGEADGATVAARRRGVAPQKARPRSRRKCVCRAAARAARGTGPGPWALPAVRFAVVQTLAISPPLHLPQFCLYLYLVSAAFSFCFRRV